MPVGFVLNQAHSDALLSVQSWGDRQRASGRDFPWPERVQNIPVALEVSLKELSLTHEVKATPTLSIISNIEHMPNRNQRLMAIGAAVTAVVNFAEWENIAVIYPSIPLAASKMASICTNNPLEHDKSTAYIKRGVNFVEGMTDANKAVDATLYSTGLGMGFDILQIKPDMNKVDHFSRLSVIREQAKSLDDKGKKEQEDNPQAGTS